MVKSWCLLGLVGISIPKLNASLQATGCDEICLQQWELWKPPTFIIALQSHQYGHNSLFTPHPHSFSPGIFKARGMELQQGQDITTPHGGFAPGTQSQMSQQGYGMPQQYTQIFCGIAAGRQVPLLCSPAYPRLHFKLPLPRNHPTYPQTPIVLLSSIPDRPLGRQEMLKHLLITWSFEGEEFCMFCLSHLDIYSPAACTVYQSRGSV